MERNTTLSTVLQVLTLLVSLVNAIGVQIVDSKVDQLTDRSGPCRSCSSRT